MHTILLVDDNEDIRDMMTRRLHQHGFAVVSASNGLEAVLQTAQSPPSLILMDVNMPELDGLEATIQIRQADAENRIPVIAITGYALDGDQERALSAGCDVFHPKPVDFDKLLLQITQLIESTHIRSEDESS